MTIHAPLEELRCSYKPDKIRALFVGESPPAGGTFFYKGNSNLVRYTEEAFSAVFDMSFKYSEDFLRAFQGLGCYLDDLCLIPVNRLAKAELKRHRRESVESLAVRIHAANPEAIVTVMRGITPQVERAVGRANLGRVPVCSVPFPTWGRHQQYIAQLKDILRRLQQVGTLPLRPRDVVR